jgi:hypothetical protein
VAVKVTPIDAFRGEIDFASVQPSDCRPGKLQRYSFTGENNLIWRLAFALSKAESSDLCNQDLRVK